MRLIALVSLALLFVTCSSTNEEKEVMLVEDISMQQEQMIDFQPTKKHSSLYDKLKKSKYLRDPNKMHIQAGRELGILPFRKNADFLAVRDSILENEFLFYLEDGEYYRKKKMSHSYPYLTKETIELIEELSKRFQENLLKKGQCNYSLLITSALRTEESQRKLRGRNRNATRDTTSHLFGASFDVSYWDFYRNSDGAIHRYKNLQKILTNTIKEMRNEKKCLVIKETGHYCFHITVMQ